MEEKDIQRINMQLASRLSKVEKENRELKRALSEFGWLIDVIKKLKNIGEIIYGNERKGIESRPGNI